MCLFAFELSSYNITESNVIVDFDEIIRIGRK